MIHLPLKGSINPPTKLTTMNALKQLRDAVIAKDGDLITTTYYRDKDVLKILKGISVHKLAYDASVDSAKCNYCESQVEHGTPLQVEHFRPKASVRAGDNNGMQHSGYYWLGLEWSNLLLACPKCNGKSAKSDRFPIAGKRAAESQPVCNLLTLDRRLCFAHQKPLIDEKPILLNPEIDHPEDFLTFDLAGNILGHGREASRGDISLEIYDLNRPELVKERLAVWTNIKNEASDSIADFEIGHFNLDFLKRDFNRLCKSLLKRRNVEFEFTLWGRYVNDNILSFILLDIDQKYQSLFFDAYLELI